MLLKTGYSLLCTVNTGIITKVKLAPSPRAFLTVEELFTFHISPRPTSSRLSKQTERVSGALKINGRTFIKQQKVLKSRFGRAFIEARPPLQGILTCKENEEWTIRQHRSM